MQVSLGRQSAVIAIFLALAGTGFEAKGAAAEIEAVANAYAVAAAEALGLANVAVSVQPTDPRLNFQPCTGPVKVLDDGGGLKGGRMVLRVGCPDGAAWSVYVPVLVKHEVSIYRFRRNMDAGESLGPQDLVSEWVPGHLLPMQAVTDPESLMGMALVRGVSAGSVVGAGLFRAKPAVEQGQRVTIVASREGFQISMEGVALESGTAGELVQVKNLNSGKALQGRVLSPGVVEVGM
jgi:flagella basal body P-ring formation protein FlgA